MDADYRVNKPQQRHVDRLRERDQLVLTWHLKGKPMSRFQEFKSGEWKKSLIKQRIQERLRIDIDITVPHCDPRAERTVVGAACGAAAGAPFAYSASLTIELFQS